MKTEKKNQHYIPKFYLRNFSFENNKKQIGIFNVNTGFSFAKAKLKTQGSKDFYYGKDGIIEDELSLIEGKLSEITKGIIETESIPAKNSNGHIDLLYHIALTDLRNPVRIEGEKAIFKEVVKRILEMDPGADISKLVPEMSHEEHVDLSFSTFNQIIETISDLDYKLLINTTNNPFVTSDFPIVKYNQFLEAKKWSQSKTGYGLIGLQIFFPISPKIILLFFDSTIYKVGFKKQTSLIIDNVQDIDSLNILQFINCLETVFYDDMSTQNYIKYLYQKSKKFKRANIPRASLSHLLEEGDNKEEILKPGKENLIIMNSSDCETQLKVNGIKVHSKGASYRLTSSAAQLRPKVNFR